MTERMNTDLNDDRELKLMVSGQGLTAIQPDAPLQLRTHLALDNNKLQDFQNIQSVNATCLRLFTLGLCSLVRSGSMCCCSEGGSRKRLLFVQQHCSHRSLVRSNIDGR